MLNIEEKYEILKSNPDILFDCHEILHFFVDYYKEKLNIVKVNIPYTDNTEFQFKYYKYYESTDEYKMQYEILETKGMSEEQIKSKLKEEFFERYKSIIRILKKSQIGAILLLNLIDHIGHYSKNAWYYDTEEKLMAKYHISIVKDKVSQEMQISSKDAVRLIESAKARINIFTKIINDCCTGENDLIKSILSSDNEEKEKIISYINDKINVFFESNDDIRDEENYDVNLNKLKSKKLGVQ